MRRHFLLAAVAALSLPSCGSSEDVAEATEASPAPETPETAEAKKLQEFQDSIEKAMGDIPPKHRDAFQTAFACEIERNNASAEPKEIDASTVRAITARLKDGETPSC